MKPDHSVDFSKNTAYQPTVEECEKLSVDYGFRDALKLREQLTDCFCYINHLERTPDPKNSDSRKLLDEVSEKCSALVGAFNRLGTREMIALETKPYEIEALSQRLDTLSIYGDIHKFPKGKKPKDRIVWSLVAGLAKVWRDQIGRKPSAYVGGKGKYDTFIDFVNDCTYLLNEEDISSESIKDVLKEMNKREQNIEQTL